MWPDRRLCDLLHIDIPIIQAPMAGFSTPDLARAVTNAGGLGSLGCGLSSPDEIRQMATALGRGTNRPFNLNFFVGDASETDAETLANLRDRLRPWYETYGLGDPPSALPAFGPFFDDARLDLLLNLRPAVASFHFGCPGPKAVAALKQAGIVLMSSASTVREAQALEAAGMDAVIAQGWEAGGHRGSHGITAPSEGVGTMALVPQVVDAVSVPVIAAGGIGDGRGIAAAFALGASGVQIGTGFLSCPEAATGPAGRAALRNAADTDTIVTEAVSGRAARALRSTFTEEVDRSGGPLAGFIQMFALSGPILEAAPDAEASFHLYGQAAALNRETGAGDHLADLAREALAIFARLSTGRSTPSAEAD